MLALRPVVLLVEGGPALQGETIRTLSTGELIRRLSNNVSGIVDREITLAKEEAREDARQVGVGAGLLVAGGLFLYTALVGLVIAAIYAISPEISPVTAALVVTAIFAVLGVIFALVGRSRLQVQPLERTRETLKEDVEWARHQATSRGK
jgi:uncharacterized membrane protein YqjE